MNPGFTKHIIFIILLTLLLCSCSDQAKIGVLFDRTSHGRWTMDSTLLVKNLQQRGAAIHFEASESDAELQYQLARKLIEQGIKILIIIPTNMNTAANIVSLAHENDVKVIGYDRMIKNSQLDFYVSFDDVQVGELQAKYITDNCPTGKYAIIGGSMQDNNSFLIRLGQLNILQPLIDKGDIEIVFDQYANFWDKSEGYRLMKECLRKHRDVEAVLVAADELTTGVWEAIEEEQLDKTPCLCGQDAFIDACQRIAQGKQTMTVYKPIKLIAEKAAEIALDMLENEEIPQATSYTNNGKRRVPTILLPSVSIDADNMMETVIADGYHTREEIYTDSIP